MEAEVGLAELGKDLGGEHAVEGILHLGEGGDELIKKASLVDDAVKGLGRCESDLNDEVVDAELLGGLGAVYGGVWIVVLLEVTGERSNIEGVYPTPGPSGGIGREWRRRG